MPLTMTGHEIQIHILGRFLDIMSMPQFSFISKKLRTLGHPYRLVRRSAKARCNEYAFSTYLHGSPSLVLIPGCYSRTGQSCRHNYPLSLVAAAGLTNPPKSGAVSQVCQNVTIMVQHESAIVTAAIHTVHPSYIRFPDICLL